MIFVMTSMYNWLQYPADHLLYRNCLHGFAMVGSVPSWVEVSPAVNEEEVIMIIGMHEWESNCLSMRSTLSCWIRYHDYIDDCQWYINTVDWFKEIIVVLPQCWRVQEIKYTQIKYQQVILWITDSILDPTLILNRIALCLKE